MSSITPLKVDEAFWTYTIKGGKVHLNGVECTLNGINWAGFENKEMVPQPNWLYSLEDMFKLLQEHQINAIRCPVSAEYMQYFKDERVTIGGTASDCPKFAKQTDLLFDTDADMKPAVYLLDKFLKLAYKCNMLVMFDLHSFPGQGEAGPCKELGTAATNISDFNSTIVLPASKGVKNMFGEVMEFTPESLGKVIGDFCKFLLGYPHVFCYDIKNEPHNSIKFPELMDAYEVIAKEIIAANPRMLIAIEGIEGTKGGWGNNFTGLKERPCKIDKSKVIYAPHQYGKGVNQQETGPPDWDANFGFIKKDDPEACIMIGEWGIAHANDGTFGADFAAYINERKFDSFYWAFQHTSADTYNMLGIAGKENDKTKPVATPEVAEVIKIAIPKPVLPPFPPQA
jgi:aryl-phospho-beta-D-glucosidase BglC (GH1 family)